MVHLTEKSAFGLMGEVSMSYSRMQFVLFLIKFIKCYFIDGFENKKCDLIESKLAYMNRNVIFLPYWLPLFQPISVYSAFLTFAFLSLQTASKEHLDSVTNLHICTLV